MKHLPLPGGSVALVDDEDYDLLARWRWHLARGYVQRTQNTRHRSTTISLHRVIMGSSANGFDVDHINGNKLDNRRANLRIATRSQNMANSGPYCTNQLGVRGIRFRQNRFIARIRVQGKLMQIGRFESLEDAKAAYAAAAQKHFGEFARVSN